MLSHPALNAALNGTAAVLLLSGYTFIRRRQVIAHRVCMVAAFLTSTAFLISYLLFHARVGSVPFHGQGWIRPVYFFILFTHIVLAAAIVPLATVQMIAPTQISRTRASVPASNNDSRLGFMGIDSCSVFTNALPCAAQRAILSHIIKPSRTGR